MGGFGYICKECSTAIIGNCTSGGEKCVLIHVRHGRERGRVEGHYNEYGGVIEQKETADNLKFRGNGDDINSHSEICNSEFSMENSYNKVKDKKIYRNQIVDFLKYSKKIFIQECKDVDYAIGKTSIGEVIKEFMKENQFLSENFKKMYSDYKAEKKKNLEVPFFKYTILFECEILIDMIWPIIYDNKESLYRKEFDKLEKYELDEYSGIVAYHSKCYKKAIKNKTFNLIPSEEDPGQSCGKVRCKFK